LQPASHDHDVARYRIQHRHPGQQAPALESMPMEEPQTRGIMPKDKPDQPVYVQAGRLRKQVSQKRRA
jgi:hypothetical protein